MPAAEQSMAGWWSSHQSSSPPPFHQSMKSSSSLLVVINRIANKADVMAVVVNATLPMLVWQPLIATLLQPHASANNTASPPSPNDEVSPLSPTSCHCRRCGCQGTLGWHCAVPSLQGQAMLSPQDGALDLPSLSAVKSLNL